ncbi:MAG: hypothetical protein AABY13_00135 [Nanoarchaeota archaeon]
MARVLILVLTVMLVLSTKRAYSGGTDPIALRVLRDLQAQNELIQSVAATIISIHAKVIGGKVTPMIRITGRYLYAKPRRLRVEILKIENYQAPDYVEVQDISDQGAPQVMLFTDRGTFVFNPSTGEVLEKTSDLPPDVLYFFNRTTGLLAALPFHDITVVGQFVQDGREHVALRIVPHANAGSKALTSRDLTLTIDDVRHVIVKAEELIADTNEEDQSFDDIPRVTLSQYLEIGGLNVMSRQESTWDERATFGTLSGIPPSRSIQYSFTPYLHDQEDGYSQLLLNAPVASTVFLAP